MRTFRRSYGQATQALLLIGISWGHAVHAAPPAGAMGHPIVQRRLASSPALSTVAVAANDDAILNPERGLYTFVDLIGGSDLSGIRATGRSLVYSTIRLDDYLTLPLPDSLLQALNAALGTVRDAHLKVLLRFAYNSPGEAPNASNTSDASLSQIQQHLTQLAPIMAQASDIIVAVEAGLIGQYGEWHDSSAGLTNPNDRRLVLEALLDAVPQNRAILVRTPGFKRESVGGPVMPSQTFTSVAVARLGHHNDCFLASYNDLDTFLAIDDAAYLATDTAYVPMAGETCALNPPRTDCNAAIGDLQAFHYDMLNGDFEPSVIAGWAAQGCLAAIEARLGYQLTLSQLSMNSVTDARAATLSIRATLDNTGFGRLFNARPLYVSLTGPGGRTDHLLADVDPRTWGPMGAAALHIDLALGSLPAGTYTVALWLPDAASSLMALPDYAVQLANTGMWDAAEGYNVLSRSFVAH